MTPTIPSTERVYYRDTYLDRLDARILSLGDDEKGRFVVFDKTVFHPQGGGQPDDQGYFEVDGTKFTVSKLSAPRNPYENPYIIKHYYVSDQNVLRVDQVVLQVIHMESRKLFARYHSAGHLLSNAVHRLYPQVDGCNGNHFPKQAFVLFDGEQLPENLQELKERACDLVNKLIQERLPLKNRWEETPRTIQFGDLPAYPCGGTHVMNTSEIGTVSIRNIKKEKKGFKIGYDLE